MTVVLCKLWRDGAWRLDALPESGNEWITLPAPCVLLAQRVLKKFKAKYGIGTERGA
jgi:hypothetical protein